MNGRTGTKHRPEGNKHYPYTAIMTCERLKIYRKNGKQLVNYSKYSDNYGNMIKKVKNLTYYNIKKERESDKIGVCSFCGRFFNKVQNQHKKIEK